MPLNDERILALFLIGLSVSIVLSYTRIPNQRSYWSDDFPFPGTVEKTAGATSSLPFQFSSRTNQESSLTMRFEPYILPFMSNQMKRVASSYLSIVGSNPIGTSGFFVADWPGNSSGVNNYPSPFGWDSGDGTGNVSIVDSTLRIVPLKPAGFLTVYNFQNRTFYSDTSNLIVLSVLNASNALWHLNILSNGTWIGLTDIQGVLTHNRAGTFVYQLPGGIDYRDPSITVQLNQTNYSTYIDVAQIQFGHTSQGSSFRIVLNGSTISTIQLLPESLFREQVSGETVHTMVPISFTSIANDNIVEFILSGGGILTISSATFHITVDTSRISPQAWSTVPYPFILYGTGTMALLLSAGWLLRSLLLWLRTNSIDQTNDRIPRDQRVSKE